MSWVDVVAQLRRLGTVAAEQPDWCGLLVEYEGKQQKVMVHRATARSAIIISARVCASRHIDPDEALAYNGISSSWTLGVVDGVYVVRGMMALSSLAETELADTIRIIVAEAVRLRRRQVAPSRSEHVQNVGASLFAHWTQ